MNEQNEIKIVTTTYFGIQKRLYKGSEVAKMAELRSSKGGGYGLTWWCLPKYCVDHRDREITF